MSDSQVGYSPEWYRRAQRKQELELAVKKREAEEQVHAILTMEDSLAKISLCNQLIALDPLKALELLMAGGYVAGGIHDPG